MPKGKDVHEWLEHRFTNSAHIVLRIDDYRDIPLERGQFVPRAPRSDDNVKAIWPTLELAGHAAEWAAKKFGHTYAVFTMVAIVEKAEPPVKITVVGA